MTCAPCLSSSPPSSQLTAAAAVGMVRRSSFRHFDYISEFVDCSDAAPPSFQIVEYRRIWIFSTPGLPVVSRVVAFFFSHCRSLKLTLSLTVWVCVQMFSRPVCPAAGSPADCRVGALPTVLNWLCFPVWVCVQMFSSLSTGQCPGSPADCRVGA